MGIALQVDTHCARFLETARGLVTASDLRRLLELKSRHPDRSPALCTLSDLRNCQLQVTTDEIRELAQKSAMRHVGPFAILVNTDLNYALARQFKAYRESCTGLDTVAVFRSLADAESWLEEVGRLSGVRTQ